jgi:hypothetical protein
MLENIKMSEAPAIVYPVFPEYPPSVPENKVEEGVFTRLTSLSEVAPKTLSSPFFVEPAR